jgi:hypothetical protein
MGKGRFLNQKLVKRTSRRVDLLKSATQVQKPEALRPTRRSKAGDSRPKGA